MSINSSGAWDRTQDLGTTAVDTEAESGSGGGDMAVFSASRLEQLRRLIQGTYTNNSAFTLPAGIVDTEKSTWDYRFRGNEEDTTTPVSGVETGIGGGDMSVYSAGRLEQLRRIVQTTYTNNSRFTLPIGVVDLETRDWERRFEGQEITPSSLPTDAESGSGGGDMRIWSRSTTTIVRSLVLGSYTNNSQFNIPGGIVDIENTAWNARFTTDRIPNEEPTETNNVGEIQVEVGEGGGDMSVFDEDRINFLRRLVQDSYVNNSGYLFPNGIVDLETTTWRRRFDGQELSALSPPGSAEGGEGGGTLTILTGTREEILKKVVEGDFGNLSGEPLPEGVVNTQGFDNTFDQAELNLGVTLSGRALEPDGSPLKGTVVIQSGDTILQEVAVQGSFRVSAGDPPSIIEGEDVDTTIYDFKFIPDAAGLNAEDSGAGTGVDLGTLRYGTLNGQVTDVDGNPVQGTSVVGPGNSVTTDSTGQYSLYAPGGIDLDIQALKKSTTKTVTVPGGGSAELDFQFGGVRVRVRFADGSAVSKVDVFLDTNPPSRETDDAGNVDYNKVPVNQDADIEIAGEFTEQISTPDEGLNKIVDQFYGAGVVGQILNDITGESVTDVDVQFDGIDSPVSRANEEGEFTAAALNGGDLTLQVALNDPRFKTKTLDFTLNEGDLVEENIRLEPAANVSNF